MPLVYLDPGHVKNTFEHTGGKGVWHNGRACEEHSFNMDVGEQARNLLQQCGIDARITQQAYAGSENLNARTGEANRNNADLLVSIHANAGVPAANGACIFYWPTTPEFADIWKSNWQNTGVGLHGDGLHQVRIGTWTNLHMVREAAMPAYLIEHGFMTNNHDFDYIFGHKKHEYRRKAAEVLAMSVCDYFGVDFNNNSGGHNVGMSGYYRLKTGYFENAQELESALDEARNKFGWDFHYKADDLGFNPHLRIYTGRFGSKAEAEQAARSFRNATGWNVYVIEA